jgi:NADH:ubiquinone oxidoreductase subunit K
MNSYLLLSILLFSIGLSLALTKRHLIMILIGIELMLNAVNLNLVAFSQNDSQQQGQIFALFVVVVAAAESVVALALILQVYRFFKTVHLDDIQSLKDAR